MGTDDRFDRTITEWLEVSAQGQLPERVLAATFERTRGSRQHVGWLARVGSLRMMPVAPALGVVIIVIAAAVAIGIYSNLPRVGQPIPPTDPRSTFLGTWSTRDLDGSSPTMTVGASGDSAVEIVVLDDLASVCSGAPSTMTGTGRLGEAGELVIPSPVLTCDDGSDPRALSGPPLEEQLQNLTFVHDRTTDVLTDNLGGVWERVQDDVPIPEPTAPPGGPTGPPAEPTTPPSEAEVAALLNGFLEARVAGAGAQQYLSTLEQEIPLLYATASGRPYDRAEFEAVPGVEWPYGFLAFKARLFAGDTVVEQLFFAGGDGPLQLEYVSDGFATAIAPTTEDGQPVAVPYRYFGGGVTLQAAHPWIFSDGWAGGRLIPEGPGVPPTTDGGQRHDGWDRLELMADPAVLGPDCQTGVSPADAAALAESIRADGAIGATAPVTLSIGEAQALVMDVKIAAGATMCVPATSGGDPLANALLRPVLDLSSPGATIFVNNGVATGGASGEWMRLYLMDAPESSPIRILAIAIVAPEARFARAVDAAAPVIGSVQFAP